MRRLAGMVMLFREAQFSKAKLPISSRFFGSVIFSMDEQLLNALGSIVVNFSAASRLMVFKEVQFSKASDRICNNSEFGCMVTEDREVQFLNELSPIPLIVSGITMVFMLEF